MASKTALPVARLRALGCRVGTIIGHWPTAPISANWQYGITLPAGVEVPISAQHSTLRGLASASVARDGRIIVRAFAPGDGRVTKAQRDALESDVAAILSAIADRLNGR